MLKQRLITAIILLAIFAATLLAPDTSFFAILTLVFISIAGWEWSRLNGVEGIGAYVLGAIVGGICTAFWLLPGLLPVGLSRMIWLVAGAAWVIGTPVVLYGGGKLWLSIPRLLRWGLGVVVLCLAWQALWNAKLLGNNFLLSVLFLVWTADSGAYFFGKAFGKHKLAPQISPGKSWEGAIGGMVCVLVLAFVWVSWIDPAFLNLDRVPSAGAHSLSFFSWLVLSFSWIGAFAAIIFLTAVSIMGDLFESLMKRSAGIKDSSQILPGHGGVLDRIDALLPVLPLTTALSIPMLQFGACHIF